MINTILYQSVHVQHQLNNLPVPNNIILKTIYVNIQIGDLPSSRNYCADHTDIKNTSILTHKNQEFNTAGIVGLMNASAIGL